MSYEEVKSTIGGRIKEARTKAGYKTQDELANALFCDRTSVSEWETNKRLPSIENILKMRDLFNCDVGYLLCEYNCETREITDIQEVTGLSEEAIKKLIEYKKYKDFFEKTNLYIKYSSDNKSHIFQELSSELVIMRKDINIFLVDKYIQMLEAINILFESEDDFSIIENITMYLFCEFARYPAKEYPKQALENREYKEQLDTYLSLYNITTDGEHKIKYSDISNSYLLKFQIQLSNLKDFLNKEREPNK